MSRRTVPLKRPDDAAGEGFARQLAWLRAQMPKRPPRPAASGRAEWWVDALNHRCEVEKSVSAHPPGYQLTTVALKGAFLETEPTNSPKISWCVSKGRGYRTLVMGGQAPTRQVGQARAEAIWRIDAGIRSDA